MNTTKRLTTLMTLTAILASLCLMPAVAGGTGDDGSFSAQQFNRAVEKKLGHKLDSNETAIANVTYNWYAQTYEKEGWDREKIDLAVEKGAKNCQNDAMIAAAKAGEFGEKLLKALVVGAGDAAEAVGKWIDEKSKQYDEGKEGPR